MKGLAYTWTNIVACLWTQRITLLYKLATCLRVGYSSLGVMSIAQTGLISKILKVVTCVPCKSLLYHLHALTVHVCMRLIYMWSPMQIFELQVTQLS